MLIDGPELMPSVGEESLGCSSDMEESDPDVFGEWPEKEREKDKDEKNWDNAKLKYKRFQRKCKMHSMMLSRWQYLISRDWHLCFTMTLSMCTTPRIPNYL